MKFSTRLYKSAREINDLENAAKGPGSYVKRRARRKVTAAWNRPLRKFWKSVGLS